MDDSTVTDNRINPTNSNITNYEYNSEEEESDQELKRWELNKLKDGMAAYCNINCSLYKINYFYINLLTWKFRARKRYQY